MQSLEQLRSSGDLAHLSPANRAAATLRLQAERMPAELLARFRLEWTRFAGEENAATRRVLHTWTGALLADMDSADSKLPALADLEGLEGETNMATVSQALYAEWRAQHVAEGVQRGIERGLAQGVERECARALARLRRHAAIKFGARTAERLSELLRPVIAAKQLDRLDRVSDWLVECQQGEELLSRVAALVGNGADGR